MDLGISLIVRNGAATLRRALEPWVGVADEVVAVDTGSTDGTVALLEELGARVSLFPWRDDFGAARNAALAEARTEWILSLDADEWVTRPDAVGLKELAARGEADAYVVETMNFRSTLDAAALPCEGEDLAIAPYYSLSGKIRLARRSLGPGRDLKWDGAVHEVLDYSARRAGYRVARAGVRLRHDGFQRKDSSGYYQKLCRDSYERGEAHAGIITALGLAELARGDAVAAEKLLAEAMAADPQFDRPRIWLGRLWRRLGRAAEAEQLLLAGLRACPGSAELLASLVELYDEQGRPQDAAVMRALGTRLFPGS